MIDMSLMGFENLHYAKLTKDDSTGITYEAPKAFPGAISLNEEVQSETAKLYADNRLWESMEIYNESAIELVVADLPADVVAELCGHSVDATTGKITYNANDNPPHFCIMGEFLKGDGTKRYFKLLKGKFSDAGLEGETKNESPEFKTFTLNATFMPRKHDNNYKYVVDESSTNSAYVAKWYDSVEDAAGGGG